MILRSHIINKNIFSLFLSLFFTCGIFISCENALSSFDDSHNQKEETSGAVQTINISGYYSAEGALPKVLTQESRSAFPIPGSTSNTPVDYYAIATNVNDTTDVIEGDVDTDGQTFVITGIRLDVTWEIEVGVKVNGIRCLYDTALPKKFTAEDASLMQNFFLKPVLSGNGSVNLDMAVDTSITDISVNLENSTQRSKWLAALEATAGDAKEISKNKIKLSNLPAGVYDLQIIFYQGSGDNTRIAYSTKQSINVITGMTTESWRSDGTDLISNTGVFNLTSTLINSYLDSVIYVGDAHRTATNHVKEANNANDGRAFSPLETLDEALNRIEAAGISRDYTIYVSGELSCNAEIKNTITTSNARSITISGLRGLTNGVPQDSLNGASNDSVLKVNTSVPVTIQYLLLTNGSATNGGGIYMGNGSQLTLSNGALINQNSSSGDGGGLYCNSGSILTLEGSATVSNNEGAGTGGGIAFNGASLNVEGNVKVYDNTDASEPANPSNIYLPDGKVIYVTGALTSGAELHVTTESAPIIGNPIIITQDYSTKNTAAPNTYFFGDNATALWNDDNTEACLKVGGGSVNVDPLYTDITISININSFEAAVADKTITIKARDAETLEEIEVGSGQGQIFFHNYKLVYHGDDVPASYYSTGTNTFTLGNNLPIGNYTLSVTGTYDNNDFSANFEVRIIKDATVETDVSHAVEIISQIQETITVVVRGEMNETTLAEISTAIKDLSTEEANVKLDLSAVTGLTTLPFNMFKDCMHLEECHLPEGITTIESQAFWLCENLKSITLPSTLTSIQGSAFYRVPADIILAADGPGFKTVGDAIYTNDGKELVFYCNKQEENSSFVVPASVEKIRDYAFCSSGIKNLSFESGSHLTEIGSTVFDCCSNLEEIIIPDSVTTIGSDAFYACSSLANVHLPSELTEVNRLFGGCPMESIVIPDKVTSIKYASFWGDSTLREITLPASLTEIVSGAFGYCSGIETVKYKGSAEQKAAMTIGGDNGTLTSAEWILNYTGD